MNLLLFATYVVLFGCRAEASDSIDDTLQRMQWEIKQLKMSDQTLKKDYDEKFRRCDQKVARLQQQIRFGNNSAPLSVEIPVAFSTRLTADMIINDSPVIFDVVDLNIGDGYDEFTGVFRPPLGGVYQLTFYGLLVAPDGGPVYIKRNDDVLCQGWLRDGPHVDTSTCTAIEELTEGDSVRVTGNSGNPADLRGGLQSGFTGFLIYDS